MYILDILNCESYTFLRMIYFVKTTLQIITIAVPIILIVMFSIKIFKAIMSNPDEMKKVVTSSVKMIISAVLIFFIPAIVNFVFHIIGQDDYEKVACWEEATYENVANAKTIRDITRYTAQINNYKASLEFVIEKLNDNYTEEEKEQVETLYKEIDKSIEDMDADQTYDNMKELKKLSNELDLKYKTIVWDDINSKLEEMVASSGASSDLLSMIMGYESTTGYCDAAHTMYKAKNLGDGTITAGYGITNYTQNIATALGYGQYFPMSAGDCVPVNVFDNIYTNTIMTHQQSVKDTLSKHNITDWSQNKIDALTSFSYNAGSGRMNIAISRYVSGGDEALWNYMKSIINPPKFREGLKKRRDGEWQIYLTGNYDTGFYSRTLQYY